MKHEELVASVNRIYTELYWWIPRPAELIAPSPAEGVLNNPDDYHYLNNLDPDEKEDLLRTLVLGGEEFKKFAYALSTAIKAREAQIAAVSECGKDPIRKVRAQRKIKLIKVSLNRGSFHLGPPAEGEPYVEEFVTSIIDTMVADCDGSFLAMFEEFISTKWKVTTH